MGIIGQWTLSVITGNMTRFKATTFTLNRMCIYGMITKTEDVRPVRKAIARLLSTLGCEIKKIRN